jgi:hypothetical protein
VAGGGGGGRHHASRARVAQVPRTPAAPALTGPPLLEHADRLAPLDFRKPIESRDEYRNGVPTERGHVLAIEDLAGGHAIHVDPCNERVRVQDVERGDGRQAGHDRA